jgi:hypothetical protein
VNLPAGLSRIRRVLARIARQPLLAEQQMLLLGRLLSETVRAKPRLGSLQDAEFRVFSQFGDDGIIQWLASHVEFPNRTFVEFGVEDYRESNTRFLLMNDDWSGLVMDGSPSNIASIVDSEYFWRHELQAKAAFIDAENIDGLLSASGLGREVGILHVDLDGNDYWVWKSIEAIQPVVAILEYNSVFGPDRSITIPYDRGFRRLRAHPSGLYFGASLRALHRVSVEKGYAFVGCNGAGNNAYFVRRERLPEGLREVTVEEGYVASRFRESRDRDGRPTHLSGAQRLEAIRGMPVFDVVTGRIETL